MEKNDFLKKKLLVNILETKNFQNNPSRVSKIQWQMLVLLDAIAFKNLLTFSGVVGIMLHHETKQNSIYEQVINTPCPQKKLEVCFLAIYQLIYGQNQKVR